MNEEQRLLKEGDEETCGNAVAVVFVFVHVCLLREHERGVLEAYIVGIKDGGNMGRGPGGKYLIRVSTGKL